MAMTYDEFVSKIDRCLELNDTIDRHHDPEERAAMNEEFTALFRECFAVGKGILEKGNLPAKSQEALSRQMGRLNSVFPRFQAQVKLRTKNEVKSGKAKDEAEDPGIGRAA